MSDASELYFDMHIFCCVNEREADHPRGCCKAKHSESLRNYMKDKVKQLQLKGVRVNNAGCLDRCEYGPVMVIYPQGVWYHYKDEADIDAIIEQHVMHGQVVERLQLTKKQKRL